MVRDHNDLVLRVQSTGRQEGKWRHREKYTLGSDNHVCTALPTPRRYSYHGRHGANDGGEQVGTNAPQEAQRTAPAFLTAFGNEEQALDAAQAAANQNPVASFLGGTSAGKLRWRKIVAKTNAVVRALRCVALRDLAYLTRCWLPCAMYHAPRWQPTSSGARVSGRVLPHHAAHCTREFPCYAHSVTFVDVPVHTCP